MYEPETRLHLCDLTLTCHHRSFLPDSHQYCIMELLFFKLIKPCSTLYSYRTPACSVKIYNLIFSCSYVTLKVWRGRGGELMRIIHQVQKHWFTKRLNEKMYKYQRRETQTWCELVNRTSLCSQAKKLMNIRGAEDSELVLWLTAELALSLAG